MRLSGRPLFIERLEGRLLLAAAPVIAKVSQDIKASGASVVGAAKIAPALTANTPVFEADFNGTGQGTGGVGGGSNLVSAGGSGAPGTTAGVTNDLSVDGAFAAGSGNFLESDVAAGASSGQTVVSFTPASAADSWEAQAGSVTVNGVNYTTLNGGLDLFVRPNSTHTGDISWFRPVDVTNISGTTGMRIILTGDSGGGLQLQLETASGTSSLGSTAGSFATNNSFSLTGGGLQDMANPFANGSSEHIGITFSTSATGQITMQVFGVAGTGAINTTSSTNLLGTQSFYASANVIGSAALPTGTWSMTDRYANVQATSVDYDTVRLYAGGAPGTFAALPATLPAVPVILNVSDAVQSGDVIDITGGGIDAASASVALALDTTGSAPATPGANAIYPTILSYDGDSQFITCKMPAGSASGVYDVWVKNTDGWSSPALMNEARALYQSDYQAYVRINIEVVGRNFEQSEFGGTNHTLLQLNNGGGGVYPQTIASLNPYDVSFNVSFSVPIGTYTIQVSNDNGVHWSSPSSGQTLAIVAHTGTDPLSLGVSWSQNFKWTNVINITQAPYNVNPNGTSDDTTAIQNAVNAAQADGGGIVYFPNGSYYSSSISIGAGVVLEGQSEANTKLYYDGTGGWGFIQSQGTNSLGGVAQLQGVAQMSIMPSNPSILPDVFIDLGDTNVSNTNEALWTANRMFVDQVNLTYSYTSGFASPSNEINDSDTGSGGITYTGAWTYATGHAGDYDNDIHYTSTIGNSFSYTFTGTTVLYDAEKGPAYGTADVYLDGKLLAAVNCNSSTTQYDQQIFDAFSSTWGTHTLTVVNMGGGTGNEMNVDALNVLTPRGIAVLWQGQQRMLLQNNTFIGWYANNCDTQLDQYCTIKDNYFEYSTGYVHDTGTYLFVEDNTIVIHPEYDQDSHGIFGRSDAYVSGNSVSNAGDDSNVHNDGEAIGNEAPNGAFNYGSVMSATATTMTVSTQTTLVNPVLYYGTLSILITYGTGMTQLRAVSSINTNTDTITLSQPFTIIPDTTSKFTLYAPNAGFTVYDNTISNCAKGIWAFGNAYDDVIADNTSLNSSGIYVWAISGGYNANGAFDDPDYFVRITGNTVIGVSRRNNSAGIGFNTGRWSGSNAPFLDTVAFAIQISGNSITGNNKLTPGPGTIESGPFSGIFAVAYGYSNESNGLGTGDVTDTVIENNVLSDLTDGITLTKCDYGQTISANSYDNQVLTFLLDSASGSYGKSDDTLVTSDNGLPAVTMQPISQSVTSGQNVTFTVAALAPGSVTYVWLDGTTVVGTNSPILTLSSAQVANSGSYNCVVSNSDGSVTSNAATLTVTLPAWLATGSVVNWNSTSNMLTVSGPTTVIADPGTAEPVIVASGTGSSVNFDTATGTEFHIGGLSLSNGATATVQTLGSSRSPTNYDVLVVGMAGASAAPTFAIDSTSTLDLMDNDLIDLYGTGTTPYGAIRADIEQSYNDGSWNKPGITSSAAAANSATYGLGYAEALTLGLSSFDGVTLGGNAVLVKYTLLGDTQLRGTVGIGDYDAVLSNYGTAQDWTGGDFHYGGSVGIGDYDDVLNNFGKTIDASLNVAPR